MERLHLRPHQDTLTGRECQFCRLSDPEFGTRNTADTLVCTKQNDTAAAHLTENGYVRHRMLEIEVRIGVTDFGLLSEVA
jgi:hypothetical protein